MLAIGLSYPLLEGCVAWVIVRSRIPGFTLRQGIDTAWCGTFGNVVTWVQGLCRCRHGISTAAACRWAPVWA